MPKGSTEKLLSNSSRLHYAEMPPTDNHNHYLVSLTTGNVGRIWVVYARAHPGASSAFAPPTTNSIGACVPVVPVCLYILVWHLDSVVNMTT